MPVTQSIPRASRVLPTQDGEPADAEPEPQPRLCSTLSIELDLDAPDVTPPARGWLEPRLRRLASLAGVASGELSLLVVDDGEMSAMHRAHTGVAGTTDVLTFDLRDQRHQASKTHVEGDLLLCRDEAARQAADRGHSAREELLLYALHGLLHLLGYDDHTPASSASMHAREDELLRLAGLPPLFAAGATPEPPETTRGSAAPANPAAASD